MAPAAILNAHINGNCTYREGVSIQMTATLVRAMLLTIAPAILAESNPTFGKKAAYSPAIKRLAQKLPAKLSHSVNQPVKRAVKRFFARRKKKASPAPKQTMTKSTKQFAKPILIYGAKTRSGRARATQLKK